MSKPPFGAFWLILMKGLDFFLPAEKPQNDPETLFRMRLLVGAILINLTGLFFAANALHPEAQYFYLAIASVGILVLSIFRFTAWLNLMASCYFFLMILVNLSFMSQLHLSLIIYLQWLVPAVVFTTLMIQGVLAPLYLMMFVALLFTVVKLFGIDLVVEEMQRFEAGDFS
ncbi:MAG: hypothetical protein ACOH5I_10265 [Oligoflexus sp.]